MKIRQLRRKDIPGVAAIYREVFNEDGERWTEESSNFHVKSAYSAGACWVAELDGEIIGFLMASETRHEDKKEVYIDSIGIVIEHRNKGFGKALWRKVESYIDSRGIESIRLQAKRKSAAWNWYCKMGFEENKWIEMSRLVEGKNDI